MPEQAPGIRLAWQRSCEQGRIERAQVQALQADGAAEVAKRLGIARSSVYRLAPALAECRPLRPRLSRRSVSYMAHELLLRMSRPPAPPTQASDSGSARWGRRLS